MNREKPFSNVMLVDDDAEDRTLFSEALKGIKLQTNLVELEDSSILIAFLRNLETLPDIIFLDLNMPIKNGIECLEEIRKERDFDHINIAIYSTSSTDRDVEDTLARGANIYIKKPVSFIKLKETLSDVLTMDFQYRSSTLDRDTFVFLI